MSLARISAFNGCVYEGGTGAKTGVFYAFVINADAVVSAMTITKSDASTTDGVTLLNISGATLKQGAFFPVADGSYISSITLASGSVILYNK